MSCYMVSYVGIVAAFLLHMNKLYRKPKPPSKSDQVDARNFSEFFVTRPCKAHGKECVGYFLRKDKRMMTFQESWAGPMRANVFAKSVFWCLELHPRCYAPDPVAYLKTRPEFRERLKEMEDLQTNLEFVDEQSSRDLIRVRIGKIEDAIKETIKKTIKAFRANLLNVDDGGSTT